ncbi:S41 family peptidase [Thalassotalea hakodatensis]|uniref:S41 family peptidase n=1 Tax=Thalassotalea hakodatensis TaxID=3030492 RepID=UPI0025748732|nr:S41 family peptidase [Thalassotalea hakodatensis]
MKFLLGRKVANLVVIFGGLFSFLVHSNPSVLNEKLNENETNQVISAVCDLLDKKYIFPEVSKEIDQLFKTKLKKGDYKKFNNARELAQQLTKDMQSISHDRHLRVLFDPKRIMQSREQEKQAVDPAKEKIERLIRRTKNHGFKQVSILDGNIGYIDLRHFDFPDEASDTVTAAMTFLENTDALIFDLRHNGGGSPSMVQLLVSYLLDAEPIQLNDIYKRDLNITKQYWSLASVPGKRRPNTDVYVLTSRSTFSAAEDFSYTLKHLNRATIIGETTGGGAHPGGREIATDRFMVWIPTARSINPITGGNWEGVGVKPHIEQSAKTALNTAHIMALESLTSNNKGSQQINQWYLTALKARSEKPQVASEVLIKYAGNYGVRTLTFENGALYYQRKGNNKLKLFPINDHLFMVEGKNDFRIKVVVEDQKVVAIQGISDNGSYSQNAREASTL